MALAGAYDITEEKKGHRIEKIALLFTFFYI
jgi:hypothetical protein